MSQGQAPPKEEAVGQPEDRPSGEGEAVAHHPGPESAQGGSGDLSTMVQQIGSHLSQPNWMTNLHAKMIGPATYAVGSARNGNNSVHLVSLKDRTCTCDHKQEGISVTDGACAHMMYVLLRAEDAEERDTALLSFVAHGSEHLVSAANRLERAATGVEADAAAASSTGGSASSSRTATSNVDPAEAAERLQDAYDEIVEDMQVKATDSLVWVQTGQDTPEELPGPGSTSVFDALLRNPDQTVFVPDDYDGDLQGADEKPGEWWKNAIRPEDVDEYITEVLE